jgi:hypothetical protein
MFANLILWFAAHLEHRCKNKKAKLVIQEQTTTPQVLHKPWCGLLYRLPKYNLRFFARLNVPSELKSTVVASDVRVI